MRTPGAPSQSNRTQARAQFGLSPKLFCCTCTARRPRGSTKRSALVQNFDAFNPSQPRYPTALAEIYNFQHTTEIDQAEPLLSRALELDPNYFPALYALGALRFCCQNRIADGIRLAEQALRLDPTSTAVRSLLIHMYLDVGDLRAAEQLLANSNQNQSAWIPIYAYRHEWQKAAAIMYDEGTRANLPIPPDARYGYFAVLMSATDSTSTHHALELFKKEGGIRWQNDETPTMGKSPWGSDMSVEIGLADLMMRDGDKVAGAPSLEMALSASDIAAVRYRRGTMWFTSQRARALALLGRTEDALGELGAFSRSGWAPDAWLLDADSPVDEMRGRRAIQTRHRRAPFQRASRAG